MTREKTSDSRDEDAISEDAESRERTGRNIKELAEQIAELPEERQEKIFEAAQDLLKLQKEIQIESTVLSTYSGPLPPPEHLAEYERIVPGAGKKMFEMVENEQRIRATVLEGGVKNDRRRIDGAILLGIGVLGIAAFATYLGEPIIAVPLGLAGFLAFVGRLLARQKRDD